MDIFISWSGPRSREIARILRERLSGRWYGLKLRETPEVQAGKNWTEEVFSELGESEIGILCLTPENLTSPWIHFEAGALRHRLGQTLVIPYLFEIEPEQLKPPLSTLAPLRSDDRYDTFRLVEAIDTKLREHGQGLATVTLEEVKQTIWESLASDLRAVRKPEREFPRLRVDLLRTNLVHQFDRIQGLAAIRDNAFLQEIVVGTLEAHMARLEALSDEAPVLRLPQSLYPFYLIRVLQKFQPPFRALALVDRQEHFWRGAVGQDILKATPEGAIRVFAFQDKEHAFEHFDVLRKHAARYHVWIVWYDRLAAQLPEPPADFSLIGEGGQQVLATYELSANAPKAICFSGAAGEIAIHERIFQQILEVSSPFDSETREEDFRLLLERVFENREKSVYDRRWIEMSEYISPLEYDKHEEKHAYFVEMMGRMLGHIRALQQRLKPQPLRVLELGAGTGIFTKRLWKLQDVEISTVEIDWACFKVLTDKKAELERATDRRDVRLECFFQDSRTFDPPGKFHVVCSSFADHHIRKQDKKAYFNNVRTNLLPGGLFLVGDEFLRPYDRSSVEGRQKALIDYHDHIIAIAIAEGETNLAELEEAAKQSGLNEQGDFKISCEEYEELLRGEGFAFEKEKIGPLDTDAIGGVYVYRITA